MHIPHRRTPLARCEPGGRTTFEMPYWRGDCQRWRRKTALTNGLQAMREFTAGDGSTWQAWQVIPGHGTRRADGALLPDEYRAGWLCFSSGAERRRLAPLPARWEERPDAELDVLRRAATPVRCAQPSIA